ncbi:MAG TPA: ABC transporter permease [Chromatiaceae bacterium]|jgi:peptide/nickel transport system permease protein|nr:ABC transporter permease [Chromatiaceae bacterium]HIB84786.1 ABC transporter permease [Chromatiaceae bacterium]HIN81822.1 ABC transporter permease [Chromatiales bacterium]HIO15159.1 ABC transporter permease [Chromatiales bacterium]HIO53981.1 ABC transporter permease [Chromatiales bacterium]
MPVVFITDGLLFGLVFMVLAYAIYASRHPHLRLPWKKVARSRMGMATLIILLAYVFIGLLDSLHFRPQLNSGSGSHPIVYSNEVLSVLDIVLQPMREHQEKTYSEPFALHLYSKETVESSAGVQQRIYPRLEFGGRHLSDPSQRSDDIISIMLIAASKALFAWLLIVLMVLSLLAIKHETPLLGLISKVVRGTSEIPWRIILLTLSVVILIGKVSYDLGLSYHVLGTDKVGQDVFYQSFKSVRTGLVIGTLTTLITLPIAITLGLMAGYFRGWVDDVIQYVYTTLNSIPGVLLIASAVLLLQVYMDVHADDFDTLEERADLRMLFLCLILGVTSWTGLCRLLRGETLKLRESDYVQAATAFGVANSRILSRHILPNVMHMVLITIVLEFSGLVLAEAVLSYVGIGVDPTTNSWGNMINSARLEMAREPIVWWSLMAAFIFMFTLVLAANLFSDTVRDAFDPRVQAER